MATIQDFLWSTRSANTGNTTYSIPPSDSAWSNFLKTYSISAGGVYEWDIAFNNNGRQKFECSCDDDGYFYIDGEYIGYFGNYGGSSVLTTARYYNAGTVHRITLKRSNTYGGPTGIAARWVGYVYNPVEITVFKAIPNPITDGTPSGTPSSTTTLQWSISNAKEAFIDNNVGQITNFSSTLPIDTGLKSIQGVNSPATKTYKLTAIGNSSSDIVEKTVTVGVYNDNTPTNFDIAPFYNLDAVQQVVYSLGNISGIDMPTVVIGSPGVTVDVNNDGAFSGSKLIENNDVVRIRFSALDFNQSPLGLTNSKEMWVQIGTLRKYFTATTRAPNTNEIFDYGDISQSIPYPRPAGNDPSDGPSTPYLVSPTTVVVDDVELGNPDRINGLSGVEIRTTYDEFTEVRYKPQGQSWSEWLTPNSLYDDPSFAPPRLIENLSLNPIEARDGNVSNPTPRLIQTRSSGILTAKNVLEN